MIKKCFKENLIEKGLFATNAFLIVVCALLIMFILLEAIPFIQDYGLFNFIFGYKWAPDSVEFGIFPMIFTSLILTAISLIIAVPLAISCAIYLEEIAPGNIKELFKPIIQTLSGIPSVIYGFFGLTVIVPLVRQNFGGNGFSILTASIILAIMILPTIIAVSQDAIKSVPVAYKEASLGLGSSHWQVIRNITLPVALPGIVAAVILGMGRAVGETLAVLMVIGNVDIFPNSLLAPARTLTSNIALEMGYATGIHYNALFTTATVLFVIIVLLMSISTYVQYRLKRC